MPAHGTRMLESRCGASLTPRGLSFLSESESTAGQDIPGLNESGLLETSQTKDSSRNSMKRDWPLAKTSMFFKSVTGSLENTGPQDSSADRSKGLELVLPREDASQGLWSWGDSGSSGREKATNRAQLHKVENWKLCSQTFLMCHQNLRTKNKRKLLGLWYTSVRKME